MAVDFVERQEAIGKIAKCFERALDSFGNGRREALEEMAGWINTAGMRIEDVELEDRLVCKLFFVLDQARREGKLDLEFIRLAGFSMMDHLNKKSVECLLVLGHRESFS